MATKTFFFKDAGAGSGGNGSLADGVQPSPAATSTIVSVSALNGGTGALQIYTTTATDTGVAPLPNAPPNSFGDSWRSELIQNGTFTAGTWSFSIVQTKAGTGTNTLTSVNFRVWKSTNVDGSSATELTSGVTSTGSDGVASPATTTFLPGSVTFTNEYLFVQIGWDTTEGSIPSNTWTINVGANSFLSTPNFTPSSNLRLLGLIGVGI